jgi:choline dehydrogenase-like flavoprotein
VLAAAGRSVAVLEEGPYITRDRVATIMREGMAMAYRNNGKFAAFGKTTIPILQGRCVGGTTFVNSAIIWRLPEKILARWHAMFGLAEGLPEQDLQTAYETIEQEMLVRPVGEEIAGRSTVLMRDGAQKMHIEGRMLHRSEKGCRGSGRCLYGCPNDAKQSTAINYLARAVADGAQVVAHARAERILAEGGRATTVIGRIDGRGPRSGRLFRVRAKRAVIVAASVIQSPNLLRRSGLGLAGGALGDHFMAHPGTTVMGVYPERVDYTRGASQGYEAIGMRDTLGVQFESINVPPEVAAGRFPGVGARLGHYIDRLDHVATWAAAVRADA